MEYVSSYQDLYSWEFTGYFQPPQDGYYYFSLGSDDASYLWIGSSAVTGYTTGNPLINNGGLHGFRAYANSIYLLAGVYYPIRIQFGENYGADALEVRVYGPGISGFTYGDGFFVHDDQSR
jgi:hypothetical protein